MKTLTAKVVSVHLGKDGVLYKEEGPFLQAELDGFVGDRHRSHFRETWKGDKQPQGTKRRNERQWSAVSVEEIAQIQQRMELKETLTSAHLGANLCFTGIPLLSQLPKGTILKFPSGAVLIVEEYNPPCLDMGQEIASTFTRLSGKPIRETDFSKAAEHCRGVVGVIEVAGKIHAGDEVIVHIYEPPQWPSPNST